jgi:hypothetical protein
MVEGTIHGLVSRECHMEKLFHRNFPSGLLRELISNLQRPFQSGKQLKGVVVTVISSEFRSIA